MDTHMSVGDLDEDSQSQESEYCQGVHVDLSELSTPVEW